MDKTAGRGLVIEWIQAVVQVLIPFFKAAHLVALFVWCGGILAMPLMLARHDPSNADDDYLRIRRATQLTYTIVVTPAAIVAIVAGTWLIFFRETLVPWLYAKLFFVALLVFAHAWIGHILVSVAESKGRSAPPAPWLPMLLALLPMIAILVLVLGKPDLSWIVFPDWLAEPRGGQLPLEVPRR